MEIVSPLKVSFFACLTLRMKKIEAVRSRKKTNKPFRNIDSLGITLNLFTIIRIIIQNYTSTKNKLYDKLLWIKKIFFK